MWVGFVMVKSSIWGRDIYVFINGRTELSGVKPVVCFFLLAIRSAMMA